MFSQEIDSKNLVFKKIIYRLLYPRNDSQISYMACQGGMGMVRGLFCQLQLLTILFIFIFYFLLLLLLLFIFIILIKYSLTIRQ